MINKMNLYRQFYKTAPVLLIIFILYTSIMPAIAFAFVINPPATDIKTGNQDDFDKKFREGRDLMDKEDWVKATEKFKELIAAYPQNNSTDAALYWLAFCYKKQKQYKESAEAINRLLTGFPTSSWADDARVMQLENEAGLAGSLYTNPGKLTGTYTKQSRNTAASSSPDASYNALFNSYSETATAYNNLSTAMSYSNMEARAPLEREDEIRLAAFQSLYAADMKRGLDALNQIFQSGSKASENLKLETLRVLRRPRAYNGFYSTAAAPSAPSPENLLRTRMVNESLLKIYPQEQNIKLRKEIIYVIASLGDTESLNYLNQLYLSESDKEIKKAILNSFVYSPAAFVGFGQHSAAPPTNQLTKLLEIMRTEKDSELRILAINNFQRFAGWTTSPQLVQTLSEIYDSETNETAKITLIQTLARINQTPASKKLLDIAKNEKSDKLRLEAIQSLGNSKDPEALKYLEELLRP